MVVKTLISVEMKNKLNSMCGAELKGLIQDLVKKIFQLQCILKNIFTITASHKWKKQTVWRLNPILKKLDRQ